MFEHLSRHGNVMFCDTLLAGQTTHADDSSSVALVASLRHDLTTSEFLQSARRSRFRHMLLTSLYWIDQPFESSPQVCGRGTAVYDCSEVEELSPHSTLRSLM